MYEKCDVTSRKEEGTPLSDAPFGLFTYCENGIVHSVCVSALCDELVSETQEWIEDKVVFILAYRNSDLFSFLLTEHLPYLRVLFFSPILYCKNDIPSNLRAGRWIYDPDAAVCFPYIVGCRIAPICDIIPCNTRASSCVAINFRRFKAPKRSVTCKLLRLEKIAAFIDTFHIEGKEITSRYTFRLCSMRKFICKEQWYCNHYCKEQSETYCENGLTFGWHIQNTSMSVFEIIISGKRNIRKCTNIYLTLGMYWQYVWGVCVWERGTRKGIVRLKPLKKGRLIPGYYLASLIVRFAFAIWSSWLLR